MSKESFDLFPKFPTPAMATTVEGQDKELSDSDLAGGELSGLCCNQTKLKDSEVIFSVIFDALWIVIRYRFFTANMKIRKRKANCQDSVAGCIIFGI